MNDFYQGEEVLPECLLSVASLSKCLADLHQDLAADISKTRAFIEQLEKDPRKDGLQSAELKHAKNLFELLQRDHFDAGIWAGSLMEKPPSCIVTLKPHQARWLYRYDAHESIRHRLRK